MEPAGGNSRQSRDAPAWASHIRRGTAPRHPGQWRPYVASPDRGRGHHGHAHTAIRAITRATTVVEHAHEPVVVPRHQRAAPRQEDDPCRSRQQRGEEVPPPPAGLCPAVARRRGGRGCGAGGARVPPRSRRERHEGVINIPLHGITKGLQVIRSSSHSGCASLCMRLNNQGKFHMVCLFRDYRFIRQRAVCIHN